jgi:hypothetical protein
MKSSCTIQERRWLVQIESKMINESVMGNTHSHDLARHVHNCLQSYLSKNKFKHCSPSTHGLFVKVEEKKIVPIKEEFV